MLCSVINVKSQLTSEYVANVLKCVQWQMLPQGPQKTRWTQNCNNNSEQKKNRSRKINSPDCTYVFFSVTLRVELSMSDRRFVFHNFRGIANFHKLRGITNFHNFRGITIFFNNTCPGSPPVCDVIKVSLVGNWLAAANRSSKTPIERLGIFHLE